MSVWRFSLAALLCAGLACCVSNDDCKLYSTCPGDLFDLAVAELDKESATKCRGCLKKYCEPAANACSVDYECNLTARCRLVTTPAEHQACIQKLYRHGYTTGTEPRKPWEGIDNPFTICQQTYCYSDCSPSRFGCDVPRTEFTQDASVRLAVRKYGATPDNRTPYVRDDDVEGRACHVEDCGADWIPAEGGIIELGLPAHTSADRVYFELRQRDGGTDSFPPTVYYPRPLGVWKSLFATAFVVRNDDIFGGNKSLGFGYGLLEESAQSLILPDGCTWEEIAVPGLRIEVKRLDANKTPILECHKIGPCVENCEPCVWYANSEMAPTRTSESTNKAGGGAVGLPEGLYEVVARDGKERVVSRREVRMKKGYMTIVRTWPVRVEP